MLLGELVAGRDRAPAAAPGGASEPSPSASPAPRLRIEPVPLPPTGDGGRRAGRRRLADLEGVALQNLRAAQEARAALEEEHTRLAAEESARTRAEENVAELRRALERLRASEGERAEHDKARALVLARDEVAVEVQRVHDEHERVRREIDQLRGTLSDHDGLVSEYAAQLLEERQANAGLHVELERAEAARKAVEFQLERGHDVRRELLEMRTQRDDLARRVEELQQGDGGQVAQLRGDVETALARAEAAEERARDAERTQGRLRRDASDHAKALRTLQAERDKLETRVAELDAEIVRARADGGRVRATAAELQAAAPAPVAIPEEVEVEAEAEAPPPLARRRPGPDRRSAMAELTAIATDGQH
jgi:chromosome segregation ATPase